MSTPVLPDGYDARAHLEYDRIVEARRRDGYRQPVSPAPAEDPRSLTPQGETPAMPQHLPDSIRIIRVSGERVRASALVARPSQNATPTTVRVPTRVGISVGDKVDARPGLVTVSATASTGQDLTDGITVATVS